MQFEIFSLGDVKLQSGEILEDAKLAYKTYGFLDENKNNVILYPSWYSGFINDNEWLIGEDKALNPNQYFIIIVCLFGNGQSSSPSNHPNFRNCTLYDNVVCQHKLVTELFGITKIKLVLGWSMGAQQTFQWACLYPEMVERILPFCGSSKTSHHNYVFLEGPKHALINSKDNIDGIKAFARVYAGWGFSQPFYKYELWRKLNYKSLEDFLVNFWESFFLKRDANNLLAMLWTWQNGNISDNCIFNGNFKKALNSIKAKCVILSPEIDLYFPKEDNMEESLEIVGSKLVIIPGYWGHFSGGGLNQEDTDFINTEILKLLNLDI